MSTLFAPFVRSVLHGSAGAYGLVVALQAVGGTGGGLFVAARGSRLRAASALGWAAIAFGVIDLAVFLYPLAYAPARPVLWPAAVLMAMVGVPGALLVASAATLLQRHTTDDHRGRVFGALGAVEGVAVVAGTTAAGLLARHLGIVPTLAAQGVGYVLAGTLLTVLLAGRDAPRPLPSPSPAAPAGVAHP